MDNERKSSQSQSHETSGELFIKTNTVAILGLLPPLLSRGAGSEVQRPLAAVVVGGLLTSTALTLRLLPTLYGWVESVRNANTVAHG